MSRLISVPGKKCCERLHGNIMIYSSEKPAGGGWRGRLPALSAAVLLASALFPQNCFPGGAPEMLRTWALENSRGQGVLLRSGVPGSVNVGDEFYVYRQDSFIGLLAVYECGPRSALAEFKPAAAGVALKLSDRLSAPGADDAAGPGAPGRAGAGGTAFHREDGGLSGSSGGGSSYRGDIFPLPSLNEYARDYLADSAVGADGELVRMDDIIDYPGEGRTRQLLDRADRVIMEHGVVVAPGAGGRSGNPGTGFSRETPPLRRDGASEIEPETMGVGLPSWSTIAGVEALERDGRGAAVAVRPVIELYGPCGWGGAACGGAPPGHGGGDGIDGMTLILPATADGGAGFHARRLNGISYGRAGGGSPEAPGSPEGRDAGGRASRGPGGFGVDNLYNFNEDRGVLQYRKVLSLKECVGMALENSAALKEKQLALEEARGSLVEAASGTRPRFFLNGGRAKYKSGPQADFSRLGNISVKDFSGTVVIPGYTVNVPFAGTISFPSFSVPITMPESNIHLDTDFSGANTALGLGDSYSMQLGFSQPVYAGGSLRRLKEIAELNMRVRECDYEIEKRKVAVDVVEAYFSAVKAQVADHLAEQMFSLAEKQHSTALDGLSRDKISALDYNRVKDNLNAASFVKKETENAFEMAALRLAGVLGLGENDYTALNLLSLEFPEMPPEEGDPEDGGESYRQRPEYRASLIGLMIAEKNMLNAGAGRTPKLNMGGNYSLRGKDFPPENSNWSVNLGFTMNLYDGGETGGKLISARASLRNSENNLHKIINAIRTEQKQRRLALELSERKLARDEEAFRFRELDADKSMLLHDKGRLSSEKLADDRIALLKAQGEFLSSQLDCFLNRIRLRIAGGSELEF